MAATGMNIVTSKIWSDAPPLAIHDEPAVLFDMGELWLAYQIAPGDGVYAVIRFKQVIEYRHTPIGDEGLGCLQYAKAGLQPYSFNELFNSNEATQNSLFSSKDSRPIFLGRHWVITFKDSALEIVARGDADKVSARRPMHCLAEKLGSVVNTGATASCSAEALLRTFVNCDRNQFCLRYESGEVIRVGDHVLDNDQHAVVEEVVLTIEDMSNIGASEFGISLRWDNGLPIYRPISSKYWETIRLLNRRP